MFSHLCRACLSQFNDPSECVPLFEEYENVLYYRICNELQLMVQHDDDLGCNVCKICSENIMKFYDFVLMYKESEKKLREMQNNVRLDLDIFGGTEFKPNMIELEDISTIPNISLAANDSKWNTSRPNNRRKQQNNGSIIVRHSGTDLPVTTESTTHYGETNSSVGIHNIKMENFMDDDIIDTKQFLPTVPITDPIQVKWKCKKCSLEYKTQQLLRSHSKIHLFKKSKNGIHTDWKEPQSSVSEDKSSSQRRHRREKHLQEPKVKNPNEDIQNWHDKVYVCDFCEKNSIRKVFNTKNKIKQHLVTHINEGRRKYLCVECGNQFCSKFGLGQHIRAIHEKEQRFQCTICERRFAHKHNLKTHMNRHEGVRPYPCTLCSKAFYDSSTLNVHTKSVHSNSNSFICNICSKTFNRNGNLKIHMVKTHNLQPPKPHGNIKRVIVSSSK